jgi:hypothetical protein
MMGLISSAGLWAQAPAAVNPALLDPLLRKRAPDFAKWSIVSGESSDAREQPKPDEDVGSASPKEKRESSQSRKSLEKQNPPKAAAVLEITKTGHVIHVERINDQKHIWNIWITAGHELSVAPDSESVEEVAPPSNPDMDNPLYTDFSKTDFPGLEWISAKNFTGVEKVSGRACLVFREPLAPDSTIAGNAGSPDRTIRYAAIDYYSRLPVALAAGGVMQEYSFEFPPQAAQTLPENVARFLQSDAAEKKETARTPSKPY